MKRPKVEPIGNLHDVLADVGCADPGAGADSWVLEIGIEGWRVFVRPMTGHGAPYRMDFEPARPQPGAGGSYSGAASMALALEAAATGIERVTRKAVDRHLLIEIAKEFDR